MSVAQENKLLFTYSRVARLTSSSTRVNGLQINLRSRSQGGIKGQMVQQHCFGSEKALKSYLIHWI